MNQLRAWAEQYPAANWALATGKPSGVWVLDIDTKPGKPDGIASLKAWLEESHATLFQTHTVETGGGGWHYYWRDVGLKNRVNVLPGVDVRGEGGYVLLPGSNHISGGVYRVAREGDLKIADERLVDLVRRNVPKPDTRVESGSLLDPIPEGERDVTLFKMACRLRRTLKDDRPAIEALVVARAIASGFSERDALVKVESAFKQDHPEQLLVDPVSRLNLRGAAQVRSLSRPAYLIDGVLPEGSLFQVFGQTGSYKSFVMLDMLASVANGLPWMGHDVAAPGPVAFILGEGGYDAGVRIEAWLAAHPGSGDELIAYSIEEQLDLMSSESLEAIVDDLEAYRLAHFPGQRWRLIVFDTQADHMPNGDEDKSRDFTVMKRSIQRIAHETGAAVGLVHHTGWDDSRERGSSRQRQALDVVMQVRARRITNIKQKGGPAFDPIDFAVEPIAESIVVMRSNPMVVASDNLDADLEIGRAVITYLVDHPGASANEIQRELKIGRSGTWPRLRDLLESLGLLEVAKGGNGSRTQLKPTELALERFGIANRY